MGVVVDAWSECLSGFHQNHSESGIGENIAGNPSAGATAYYTDVEDLFAHVTFGIMIWRYLGLQNIPLVSELEWKALVL